MEGFTILQMGGEREREEQSETTKDCKKDADTRTPYVANSLFKYHR